MPDVNYLLTRTFRTQWSDFWRTRPKTTPPAMEDAIRRAAVVSDFSHITDRPRAGAEFWEVGEMPGRVVVAVREGDEYKVIAIRRSQLSREPVVSSLPSATTADRLEVLEKELAALRERVATLEARAEPEAMIAAIRNHTNRNRSTPAA